MRETNRRMGRIWLGMVLGAALLFTAPPVQAAFHIAVIDEVMTSYGGDDEVQFVEIRMLFMFQNFVTDSVFAAFDAQGTYINDILVVPANVTNHGDGVSWIIGTEKFQTASGLTPDFIFPAGILPAQGGMLCFGGGFGAVFPQEPGSWDRTNFQNYVDCLAYGTYSGPTNIRIGTATSLSPAGHSLQRVSVTTPADNATNYECADTSTPQNNAAAMVELPATVACEATPPCPGDCNADGEVSLDEIIRIVNVALGLAELGPCSPADANSDGHLSIDELVAAVASTVTSCPIG